MMDKLKFQLKKKKEEPVVDVLPPDGMPQPEEEDFRKVFATRVHVPPPPPEELEEGSLSYMEEEPSYSIRQERPTSPPPDNYQFCRDLRQTLAWYVAVGGTAPTIINVSLGASALVAATAALPAVSGFLVVVFAGLNQYRPMLLAVRVLVGSAAFVVMSFMVSGR